MKPIRRAGGKARFGVRWDRFRNKRRGRVFSILVFTLSLAGFGALGYLVPPAASSPQERSFTIRARQYAYDPHVIRVNRGDTIRLRFVALDVVHGFYLEGYDIDVKMTPMQSAAELMRPSHPDQKETVEEVVFKADQEGKFRFRCSKSCGFLHPFMLGELIVAPNRLLPTSLGLAAGVLLGGFLVVSLRDKRGAEE